MTRKVKSIFIIAICIILIGIGMFCYIKHSQRNYEIEEILTKDYYTIYKNSKVGVINTNGDILIEPTYDEVEIPNPSKPVFVCLSNNKYTIRNEQSQEIFKNYDEVVCIPINGITSEMPYEISVLKYKENNLYGLLSFDGKAITKALYEDIKSLPYKESEFLVKKNGKYGVINPKGKEMLKIDYDEIMGDGYFDINSKNAGYVVGIKKENSYVYSYIRNDGKVLLKNEFNDIVRINDIQDSKNIYLIASKNGKKGLFVNGKQKMECDYQTIEYNQESKLIIVKRNDKYGVYNLSGDVIIPTENKEISIRGIRIVAKNDNEIKEYDFTGTKIRDNKYKSVSSTPNEDFFITVNQSNRYGLINKNNIEVIENKYAYLEYLTGRYFTVYSDENKIGVIDSDGKLILDMKYDVVQKIKGSNIIQAINIENKLIELYTEEIKQIGKMEDANIYIYDNYVKLVSQYNVMYFKFDGNKISSKELFKDNTLFPIVYNGKWGYENKDGKIVIGANYDYVTDFNEYGFAGIEKDEKWGVIEENGKILVEPIYKIEQRSIEPEFIGKYYKTNYNGSSYFSDEVR